MHQASRHAFQVVGETAVVAAHDVRARRGLQEGGGDLVAAGMGGGHVAGAVNPPNPKAWFEAVGAPDGEKLPKLPEDPKAWSEKATRTAGSWWEDWTAWSTKRAGELVAPPAMGSAQHPPLCDAPGTYVFE